MRDPEKPIVLKIYGDSLSLPRPFEGIEYGEEYCLLAGTEIESILGRKIKVYNRSFGGATVERLSKQFRDDRNYLGDGGIVVIQCGVVDCAPRPLPSLMRRALGYFPGIVRKPVVKFLHDNRALILKKGLGTRLTSPSKFGKRLRAWIEEASASHDMVLVINIAPTNQKTEDHSPGFSASINRYNEIIRAAVSSVGRANVVQVDVNRAISDEINGLDTFVNAGDGHHITRKGHILYGKALSREVGNISQKLLSERQNEEENKTRNEIYR
ncbi:MAG TPA: SGNH/GDSL hydrolase family protein [Acidobacteriota bacterium]|nr:SGNH/GDSL hydrolase family protein [Acidobacteriota bacterium]HNT17618.1 SGNH/GDSL hydrolase family protein [Acidobacteriota bacterium]